MNINNRITKCIIRRNYNKSYYKIIKIKENYIYIHFKKYNIFKITKSFYNKN